MIPEAYLTEWQSVVPWKLPEQVEQDLIICRALVELFSQPVLREHLVFRGGTALYKLHLRPAARYSEDIDLVQIKPGPNKPIIEGVRAALDGWLGSPRYDVKERGTTMVYRMTAEIPPVVKLRLKLEINTREHFSVLPLQSHPFAVQSGWFRGRSDVPTYHLDELLGTKVRALYQRNKGRDLFDLWYGIRIGKATPVAIVSAFRRYLAADHLAISQRQFQQNLAAKIKDEDFLADTDSLLPPGLDYDPAQAHHYIEANLTHLLSEAIPR